MQTVNMYFELNFGRNFKHAVSFMSALHAAFKTSKMLLSWLELSQKINTKASQLENYILWIKIMAHIKVTGYENVHTDLLTHLIIFVYVILITLPTKPIHFKYFNYLEIY